VVSGLTAALDIFDLVDLTRPGGRELDLESLRTLGEIVSGRRAHASGSVKLSSSEWLSRWQSFRKRHPQCFRARIAVPEDLSVDAGELTGVRFKLPTKDRED
jgi:hypothetical protein